MAKGSSQKFSHRMLTSKKDKNPASLVKDPGDPPFTDGAPMSVKLGFASVKERPYVGNPITSFSLLAPLLTHSDTLKSYGRKNTVILVQNTVKMIVLFNSKNLQKLEKSGINSGKIPGRAKIFLKEHRN